MSKKKIIILIISLISFLSLLFIGYFGYKNYIILKTKNEIITTSNNFVRAWYTYSRQSDSNYLENIKPYMTSSYYEATSYISLNRPQDFIDQPASKIIINKIYNPIINGNEAKIKANVTQIESVSNKKTFDMDILLIKENNFWLVSNFN